MTELRSYDEEATQLRERLREIPADTDSQRLSAALTGIRTRVTALLDQAERGRTALERAREGREKRSQEIHAYKLFLDETDAWLKDVASRLHEQQSFGANKVCRIATGRLFRFSNIQSAYNSSSYNIFNSIKLLQDALNIIKSRREN